MFEPGTDAALSEDSFRDEQQELEKPQLAASGNYDSGYQGSDGMI